MPTEARLGVQRRVAQAPRGPLEIVLGSDPLPGPGPRLRLDRSNSMDKVVTHYRQVEAVAELHS